MPRQQQRQRLRLDTGLSLMSVFLIRAEASSGLSLSSLQQITGFSTACETAYQTVIPQCPSASYFLSNNSPTCSLDCFNALTQATKNIQAACSGGAAWDNTVISHAFKGDLNDILCSGGVVSGTSSPSSSTSTASSTTATLNTPPASPTSSSTQSAISSSSSSTSTTASTSTTTTMSGSTTLPSSSSSSSFPPASKSSISTSKPSSTTSSAGASQTSAFDSTPFDQGESVTVSFAASNRLGHSGALAAFITTATTTFLSIMVWIWLSPL